MKNTTIITIPGHQWLKGTDVHMARVRHDAALAALAPVSFRPATDAVKPAFVPPRRPPRLLT